MSADPACRAPVPPEGAVPRTCVPFAHVPAVPVVAVPYVPVPVPSGLPVLSVAGILPDRTGNVDVTRFLEEWAAGPLADKADKAVPLAAGNLASLDAAGNLSDSGATPASIARSAVEAVVANAPGTMDTLKEIADILGSSQQSGTVLKRISDLESGKADSSSLARVATSGSYDDLLGKPTIPAVTVDATLTTQGAAADAKAVGDALRSEFTEWVFSGDGYDAGHTYTVVIAPSEEEGDYDYMLYDNGTYVDLATVATDSVLVVYFSTGITATRHFATPTKTSQLTNDGAPSGGGTPYATTAQIPTVPSAYISTPAMDGVGSAGSSTAWARGDHVHPTDTSRAAASDLPYRLVEPGAWEFSGVPSGVVPTMEWNDYWILKFDDWQVGGESGSETDSEVEFSVEYDGQEYSVTATRNVLLDRAGNRVVVSGDTTLTLPAAVPGYLRDFLVRLEIGGSTVPTITFAAPTGETLTYETDGDEFPVPDEAGDWLYSFTESCVTHKFAVSLKKVNEVAQGGS